MNHDTPAYEVLVGNVGNVYRGSSATEANRAFNEYAKQSRSNVGRAGGEDVTMFLDGEVAREYVAPQPAAE